MNGIADDQPGEHLRRARHRYKPEEEDQQNRNGDEKRELKSRARAGPRAYASRRAAKIQFANDRAKASSGSIGFTLAQMCEPNSLSSGAFSPVFDGF